MSGRTIWWIVAVVVLLHGALFLYLGRARPMAAGLKVTVPAKPNFGYQEEVHDDPATGERTTFREIRVSTKLADTSKLPPPSWATPAPAVTPAAATPAPISPTPATTNQP